MRSYRTYEEWKRSWIEHHGVDGIVLTVPMRNGNGGDISSYSPPNSVLTVPMRNGNKASQYSFLAAIMVLTVPMRNGNRGMSNSRKYSVAVFLPYL